MQEVGDCCNRGVAQTISQNRDLGPRNLQSQILWQTLPNLLRQAVVDMARSNHGNVHHGGWRRSGDGHSQPDQRGQGKAGQSGDLQPKSMPRTKVANYPKGQQEDGRGKRRQYDQRDVDGAVQALASVATRAIAKMFFVIATHFRGQARNVIPPPGENLAYNRVDTLFTHLEELQSNRVHGSGLRSQHYAVLYQGQLLT